ISCSQDDYRMRSRILSASSSPSSRSLDSTTTMPACSQQQLATLRTPVRWSNTPVPVHVPTAPAGALPTAVRTLARSSTTAVEPGLIVLVLQAAYLCGDHREVVCADQHGPTGGAVVPAPPVRNPGVVVL